jgi:hypothetical protein
MKSMFCKALDVVRNQIGIRKPRGNDIKWSNLHTSLITLKVLMLIILLIIVKTQEPQLMRDLPYVYHSPKKGKHR